jgi:tetratricopeptide (TPR) repeat protein
MSGLTFEEEGLEKRRDPQTRSESKTRLVEQIKIYLHSREYTRALDLLRGTAAEFPDDAEFSELEKLADDGIRRKVEADRLITESQELFAQQKPGKAIQLLREAYELDKSNSLARSILANALVEHAYSIVETDWWEAEALANEALALNPAHPTARSIHSRILDQKTTGSVEEWVSQTRKLQSSGNLSAALSQIAEAFAVYPRHPRLLQLQDAIQRDHSVQRRQVRRRDLEDLRRMESEINAVPDVASRNAFNARIRAATAKYSTDGEFLSVANSLLQRLGLVEVPQKSSTATANSEGATVINHSASPPAARASAAAANEVPSIPFLPHLPLPTQVPSGPIPHGNPPSAIPPSKVPFSKVLPSAIPQTKVETAAAEPQLSAQAAAVAAVEDSAPEKVASQSQRPEQATRSKSATLILASAAAMILFAAVFFFFARKHYASPVAKNLADLPAVSAPDSAPVSAPTLSTPKASAPSESARTISAPTVSAPVISAPAASAPAASAPPRTARKQSLSGTFIESGHNIEPGRKVDSGRNLGALLIVAGEDNASVLLNGKLQSQHTQSGQLLLPNLDVKDYVVQVTKSGFRDPPQQTIRVHEGEQAKLVFNLQPVPHFAWLIIQGGITGTTVLVDQTLVGTIQPDGKLSVSTISPGDRSIELHKEGFKARKFEEHFVEGGAISLAAPDAALEAAPSELKISYAPADAKVAIVKAGELPKIVSSGVPLNVSAGTYTLTARTAESITRFSTFEVIAGQSKTFNLSLAPSGMSKWDNPDAWKHAGDSFMCKGGEFVLYGVVPASGTFVFSAMLTKGHLLQWVLNYSDPKNYLLFQMDDNYFHRTVIRNGEKTDEIMVPDKGDKKSFRTLHIRVSPTEIVNQIRHGDDWKVLDRWTQPGVNLSRGKFGFYIPGSDEVELSSFGHYSDLNVR